MVENSGAPVVGVVMAGGLSRRMGGGDKFDINLNGKTLLEITIERAQPQVDCLILNANVDPDRFADCELPVVADCIDGFAGPLAGILTGMHWARENQPGCEWIASFACDTPFFPIDIVARFQSALKEQGAEIACAKSGPQLHPVFGLWPVRLYDDLRHALVDQDMRRMGAWLKRHRYLEVCFEDKPIDPFFNINTPDDLAQARGII